MSPVFQSVTQERLHICFDDMAESEVTHQRIMHSMKDDFDYNFLSSTIFFYSYSMEEEELALGDCEIKNKTPSIMENNVAFMSWRDALQLREYELCGVSVEHSQASLVPLLSDDLEIEKKIWACKLPTDAHCTMLALNKQVVPSIGVSLSLLPYNIIVVERASWSGELEEKQLKDSFNWIFSTSPSSSLKTIKISKSMRMKKIVCSFFFSTS